MVKLLGGPSALLLVTLSTTEAFGIHNQHRSIHQTSKTTSTQRNIFKNPFNEGKKALVKSLAGDYDKSAVKDRLDSLIANEGSSCLMLSFTTWPFCVKAKEVLDGKNAKYTVVELDTDIDGKAIRAEMADLLDRTSVPAIWIGGKFVGGCNDGPMGGIIKLEESGSLDGLLKSAGVV